MDRNLLLAFALSFAVLALWTMTQESPRGGPAEQRLPIAADSPSAPSSPPAPTPGALPSLPAAAPAGSAAPASALPIELTEAVGEGEIIRIETPLYAAELTTLGAGLRRWELEEYDEGPRRDHQPLVLTTGESPLATALLTPFEELGRGNLALVPFDVERPDSHTVVFKLTRDGVTVKKTFSFREESYEFRLRVEVVNGSDDTLEPRFGVIWPAHVKDAPDFKDQALVALHDGSVVQQMLRDFGKPGFFSREPTLVIDYPMNIDWAGVQNTYFLSALLPESPSRASARFVTVEPGKAGATQVFFEPEAVPPGKTVAEEFKGYIGPKERPRLESLGASTLRSVDLGWSWMAPVTHAFNWMLQALYSLIPNYGVAIILLTILVRVVTAPLTVKQMRSMERMRALSPKLKEIQAKFKDDRQRQSEETMRLYRQEKVNPLGGCLPMVLQLPVFIGLFYALRSSIELRQAPFFGWIDDLSTPELLLTIPGPFPIPIRVLPLIMGATMVLQQRITPMPSVDPAQAKMMQTVMPIMMTVLFYQFPSGLVLYWMVSNILAIAHQKWIGRSIHAPA